MSEGDNTVIGPPGLGIPVVEAIVTAVYRWETTAQVK